MRLLSIRGNGTCPRMPRRIRSCRSSERQGATCPGFGARLRRALSVAKLSGEIGHDARVHSALGIELFLMMDYGAGLKP